MFIWTHAHTTHPHTQSLSNLFSKTSIVSCRISFLLFSLLQTKCDNVLQQKDKSFNTILPFHGDRAGYCLHTIQKQFSNVSDQRQKFCSAEQSSQIVLNITIPRKFSEQGQKNIPPLNLLIREIKHTVQPEVTPKLKCHSDKNNWEHVKIENKNTFQSNQAKPVLAYPALPMSLLIFSMFT